MKKSKVEKRSKCVKCLTLITTEEFLKYDHRCKKCDKLPNYQDTKKARCTGCRHAPHKEKCNECIETSGSPLFKPVSYCGCEVITK